MSHYIWNFFFTLFAAKTSRCKLEVVLNAPISLASTQGESDAHCAEFLGLFCSTSGPQPHIITSVHLIMFSPLQIKTTFNTGLSSSGLVWCKSKDIKLDCLTMHCS